MDARSYTTLHGHLAFFLSDFPVYYSTYNLCLQVLTASGDTGPSKRQAEVVENSLPTLQVYEWGTIFPSSCSFQCIETGTVTEFNRDVFFGGSGEQP